MGYYEDHLDHLKTIKRATEGMIIYHKSIISIMKTILVQAGENDLCKQFDTTAINNIIKINETYISALENKIDEFDEEIKEVERKIKNGCKSSEYVDALLDTYDDTDFLNYAVDIFSGLRW